MLIVNIYDFEIFIKFIYNFIYKNTVFLVFTLFP